MNNKLTHSLSSYRRYGFLSLCLAALLGGCGNLPTSENNLETRVQNYWNAILAKDPITAYNYEEAFVTKKPNITDYVKRSGQIEFSDLEILNTEKTSNDEAYVQIKYKYKTTLLRKSPATQTSIKERWRYLDNQWYRATEQNPTTTH